MYESRQDRGDSDDPELPVDLVRGTTNSVLDPLAVRSTEIVDSGPRIKPPAEQIKEVMEKLRVDAGLPKEFNAEIAIGDPQAAIAEWQRMKKLGLL